MTNTPGDDQAPQDPYQQPSPYGQQQPTYGQPSQPGQPGQPGQPSYGQQPPYGQPQGYPPVSYAPNHPRATTALVLGILGIVLCGFVAPFAWVIGKKTVNEIDASQGQLDGRGSAQAGYVLGVIGTILLALGILAAVAFAVLIGLSIETSSTTTG